MSSKKYLYGDTETTGYSRGENIENPDQPYLVELSGILADSEKRILGRMHRIIKPDGWVIPKSASDVHGITQEIAMAEGVPMWQALWEYDRLVTQCDALVFHNAKFDHVVLRVAHLRLNHMHRFHSKEIICTMKESTSACKMPGRHASGYKQPKLSEAYQILTGKTLDNAHTSDADTEACMEIHWALMDLESQIPGIMPSPSELARNTMVEFLKNNPWMASAAGPLFAAALAEENRKQQLIHQSPCLPST